MVDIQPHRSEKTGSAYQGFRRRRTALAYLGAFILSGLIWFAIISVGIGICRAW